MKPHILIDSDRPHLNPDKSSLTFGDRVPSVFEVDQTCDHCGKSYIALTFKGKLWTTANCIPCSESIVKQMKDEELRGSLEKLKNNFRNLCPAKYRDFKRDLLPNPRLYDQVLDWQLGKKGLILMGDSGKGKTRCAWQLMKRLYLIEHINFKAITELEFSHEVATFGKSDTLASWISDLCRTKVLFIDDLGKSVMTERMVSELMYIFEERTKHNRPFVITMQIEASNLHKRFSSRSGEEVATAILNRLKDHCEIINF